MSKATTAVQVLDTVEFRHHNLTLPDITPDDRIVHGVTNLTCTLRVTPTIVCDNQLALIQALRQTIQKWDHPTLTSSIQVAPVPPPLPTPKRNHSIMRPIRRHAPVQPPASLTMVFIPTPKSTLSAQRVPYTQ